MVAIPLSILLVGWFCVYSAGLLLSCVGLMLYKGLQELLNSLPPELQFGLLAFAFGLFFGYSLGRGHESTKHKV
jgi:hypothetical protein